MFSCESIKNIKNMKFYAVGGNSLIIKIWGKDAAPPTHAIHFSFGVGALIVPQIARLFLPTDSHASGLETTTLQPTPSYMNGSLENTTVDALTTQASIVSPAIEYPYAIVGGITASVGLAELVIFFFRGNTLKVEQPDESGGRSFFNLSDWIKGTNKILGLSFILLIFIFWSLPIGQ